uniref:HMG box domain-containing protein n=1 Tax=Alexandrium catenella TaxID=2925 RepID=A0A6T9J3A1_ALECA
MTAAALEQPKKPVGGAYGVFLAKHRAEFAAATKGQKASAVSKMASERWAKLGAQERAPFEKEFKVVKEKYDNDMKAFLESGGEKKPGVRALATQKRKAKEGAGGGKRRRLAKDPNRPKKPAGGAFGVFLNRNRAEFQKKCPGGVTEVAKLASEKWKALADAQKEPFVEEFQRLLAAYKEAMKSYTPPEGAAGDAGEDGEEDQEEEEEEGGALADWWT